MQFVNRRQAIWIFLAFAFAYFFSALIRAVTATLSPTLTQEFELGARDLGLLAGGYFLGFAAMQLPLGRWLDRHGPRTVILGFMAVAVAGCAMFALSTGFTALLLARVLCGVGLAAGLMAPMTGYRRWFTPATQMRANSWMLMTGSMGMVASTLPVQWLLPVHGWRPLFWGLAVLLLLAMVMIAWKTPRWQATTAPAVAAAVGRPVRYADLLRHPYFLRLTPLGFFNYGSLLAVQTLWAVPWMMQVGGYSAAQAATGLFAINLCMLTVFWLWGLLLPRLTRRGVPVEQLIAWGVPPSLALLALLVLAGPALGAHAAWLLALFCLCSSVLSLAQPAVGLAFASELAGRALSAYNLVIFGGVFVVQWGIGLLIDALRALDWAMAQAYQGAFGVLLVCNLLSYVWFLWLRGPRPGKTS
ncbi:major facilitator transporter [Hylemonella gracilis str. Niagara R]|uniref:Major facilitator transporter n=1 Tax=Hylemonella gracilis str. Niagara R TaxID=1458275 RepID=A0A016XC79_9BURK|nr:MFS transporter [Hylemonella gracilis]EYC49704.1 major facilitator transporter [Hylemonella gracilis str. Niagara R]